MATRLKTVEYWIPLTTTTVTDATVTNLPQITVYLPETGTKTFRKVKMSTYFSDVITVTGGTLTEYRTALRLGAAGYTTVTNTNDITNSGENIFGIITADFTSHFTSNWSGTSMTLDTQVYFDQNTGTTLGMNNVSAKLEITYEYDDTSTTHVKTVWHPLASPNGTLATSKPGTATSTIEALDTWCPEASKSFRQMTIVVQGSRLNAGTDPTISIELDTAGVQTTGAFENALATDSFIVIPFANQSFTTNATHNFYIWGSAAHCEHLQIWLVVTYEFDASSTTTVLNSLLLPMEIQSPMGSAAADYQRAERDVWVQEPTTITGQRSAFIMFFEKAAAIAGLNARVGTGSFVAFTDGGANYGGGSGLMLPFTPTVARGKNTYNVDVYRTDTTDLGFNASGFFIFNYTSGKATDGVGAHAHTVKWNIKNFSTTAAVNNTIVAATAPVIPETDYFFVAVGANATYLSNTTSAPAGVILQVERLASGEGGLIWEGLYADSSHTDPEVGIRQIWATGRDLFKRFNGDVAAGGTRVDIETSRRYKIVFGNGATTFHDLDLILTYHTITQTVSGTISGSGGGTVNIKLYREDKDEHVMSTSRSGNGSYSFTWYDNTANIYVVAKESNSLRDISKDGTAATDFDINVGTGGSSTPRGSTITFG